MTFSKLNYKNSLENYIIEYFQILIIFNINLFLKYSYDFLTFQVQKKILFMHFNYQLIQISLFQHSYVNFDSMRSFSRKTFHGS